MISIRPAWVGAEQDLLQIHLITIEIGIVGRGTVLSAIKRALARCPGQPVLTQKG